MLPGQWCDSGVKVDTVVLRGVTVLLQRYYLDSLREEEAARTVLLHSVVNCAQIVEIHRFGESCACNGDGNGHSVKGVTGCNEL
jgi:hypothetical protein